MQRLVAALLVTILVTSRLLAGDAYLVRDGHPQAEIVIAESPERSVRFAAADLQTYVQKISGARLPIVTKPTGTAVKLFVGRSPHTDTLGISAKDLKFGAYRLVSGPDWMAFIGNDTNFTPIEPWARKRSEVDSPMFYQSWDKITGDFFGDPQSGVYKHQFTVSADIGLPDGSPVKKGETAVHWDFDERGSHNAVCGFLERLGVRWYMPCEIGEIVPAMKTILLPKIDETVKPDFELRRFDVRFGITTPETARWAMRLGIRDTYGLTVAHGLSHMTLREGMFEKRPEWFALYGGKRHHVPGSTKNKLCLSRDDFFEATVKYARVLFDHYKYEGVSVMPPDGYTAICQCPLCQGKDEPGRGSRGSLSNHVWDFVNRVAKETGKTHPNKLIVCCAYGANSEPPTNVTKLEPNVQVVIVGGRRPKSGVEAQAEIRKLRERWYAKTNRPIMIFENYPFTSTGWYLPAYMARTIGNSINETKGRSIGEDIWLTFGPKFQEKDLGFNHFQVYFTARMYWGGPKRDVGAMLEEYCRLFYGPAGDTMREFFDYCELHWQAMETDKTQADAALVLFAKAKSEAPPDSVYAKRLALIDEYLESLRRKAALLAQKRGVVPKLRLTGTTTPIVLDGKLEDAYWKNCPVSATGRLRELQTGQPPAFGTTVKAGWIGENLYLGIRCDDRPGDAPRVGTKKSDDTAIWFGDAVEVLLASDSHSYYQIVVNPAGALLDYDRGVDRKSWANWSSQAEVKTHIADDYWTAEIRIPMTQDDNDPLHQVIGRKPTSSLPWYINVCRQRLRDSGKELSALSPTGTSGFHDPMKFAHFYAGRSHEFEADPNATNFLTRVAAAKKLLTERKSAEAITALVAISEEKLTLEQKAFVLEEASRIARILKDHAQAAKLADQIPIEAVKKNSRMELLLAQKKAKDLLAEFADEDIASWPFWKQAEGYVARGKAYAATGDGTRAERDFKQALQATSNSRLRDEISSLLKN